MSVTPLFAIGTQLTLSAPGIEDEVVTVKMAGDKSIKVLLPSLSWAWFTFCHIEGDKFLVHASSARRNSVTFKFTKCTLTEVSA